MADTPKNAKPKRNIKFIFGIILISFGILSGLGNVLFSGSWKEILSNGIALSVLLTAIGYIVIRADRRNYHMSWMSILGGLLISIAFLGLAVEFENYVHGLNEDLRLGIIITGILSIPGILLLYLGYRRHIRLSRTETGNDA